MAGKMPGKTNEGKVKNSERNHQNSNGGCSSIRQGNTNRGGRGRGRGERGGGEETTTVNIWKTLNVSIVVKRANILPTAQSQEKMTINSQTWYPSRISKTYFNPH
jgi:hypothetical protein